MVTSTTFALQIQKLSYLSSWEGTPLLHLHTSNPRIWTPCEMLSKIERMWVPHTFYSASIPVDLINDVRNSTTPSMLYAHIMLMILDHAKYWSVLTQMRLPWPDSLQLPFLTPKPAHCRCVSVHKVHLTICRVKTVGRTVLTLCYCKDCYIRCM